LKRKEEAVEWYRKAIALNPSHANAHFNMGVALNDLRRKEEAQKEICRAIELNPCK
jgi:Flp pilus assembly protein TadD